MRLRGIVGFLGLRQRIARGLNRCVGYRLRNQQDKLFANRTLCAGFEVLAKLVCRIRLNGLQYAFIGVRERRSALAQ